MQANTVSTQRTAMINKYLYGNFYTPVRICSGFTQDTNRGQIYLRPISTIIPGNETLTVEHCHITLPLRNTFSDSLYISLRPDSALQYVCNQQSPLGNGCHLPKFHTACSLPVRIPATIRYAKAIDHNTAP